MENGSPTPPSVEEWLQDVRKWAGAKVVAIVTQQRVIGRPIQHEDWSILLAKLDATSEDLPSRPREVLLLKVTEKLVVLH